MTGFLTELGKRMAERWVALLVLPGLVFTAVATVAVVLGHDRWADTGLLLKWSTDLGGTVGGNRPVPTAFLLIGVLAASVASAFVARALATPYEALLLGRWPFFLSRPAEALTRRRKEAWRRHDRRHVAAEATGEAGAVGEEAPDDEAPGDDQVSAEAAEARNRIALVEPSLPTWTGDRMRAPAARVRGQYLLDLGVAWPRLWLLLPETTREPLTEARQRFDDATTLGGWAVLYTALGALWWPGVVVGAAVALVAWRRVRAAADTYAELVEAAVDVHVDDLLAHFDDEFRPVRPHAGARVTERFRKGM
ncbi:hypothetical protein [Streptomyces macrosporus]|uniref:Vegetative cell wall protein gp1 n=1 Tax=Streptomyces macrosporus TaxID=44032 RepID=A0ABN3KKR7_9ACTN